MDLNRRVQVPVDDETATIAMVGSLIEQEPLLIFLDMSSSRAGLCGERRFDLDQPSTSFRDFVPQLLDQNA
jgi:hypothetical protein